MQEKNGVLRLANGSSVRISADASLLIAGILMNPVRPEAGENFIL
jgi:hypothetical protein